MGRRKVRHYNGREYYKELLNNYFNAHHNEVMREVLDKLGFDTVENMSKAEYKGYFGFDCGWIRISPKNSEQSHEWFLDNNRISSEMTVHNPFYNTQSTTITEIMVEKALRDLGLRDEFYVSTHLD